MKKRYDSYKPSGIDWIGDIPSHWEVIKLKHLIRMKSGASLPPEKIDPTDGFYPVFGGNGIRGFTSDFNNEGEYVLIGRQGALCGNINYTYDKFWVTEHAVVCYPLKFLAIFWLGELLRTMNLNRYNVSAAQPGLAIERIKELLAPVPPIHEQVAIAAWLDNKCGEIDAAIAKVDREIELIDELKQSEISRVVTRGLNPDAPLRPSGIDWIGDIPEHWKMCRFKNFMYLKTTPSVSDIKVGLENLESGSGKFIESDTEFEGNGVEFCTNNILYGKLRPYLKKVWLAEFSGNAIGDFFVFSNCPNSNASYLKYVLLSDGFTKQADGSTFGAKMPRVSSEFILTLPFYLPPLSEQQAIADYLDKKCAEIDGLKAKLNRKRETLTELRQSIISEVVTGKRKVI